jgi:hypothetical protein
VDGKEIPIPSWLRGHYFGGQAATSFQFTIATTFTIELWVKTRDSAGTLLSDNLNTELARLLLTATPVKAAFNSRPLSGSTLSYIWTQVAFSVNMTAPLMTVKVNSHSPSTLSTGIVAYVDDEGGVKYVGLDFVGFIYNVCVRQNSNISTVFNTDCAEEMSSTQFCSECPENVCLLECGEGLYYTAADDSCDNQCLTTCNGSCRYPYHCR